MRRKCVLAEGQIYHIFNRSIAEFKIFNHNNDYFRILYLFQYFQIQNPPTRFSYFINSKLVSEGGFFNAFSLISKDQNQIVQIIAYCLMPTHIHLILKQTAPSGISLFMGNVLNSYARYFNTVHHRKGPLWESKFQNILVETDEQLLHLSRYIHLNPTSASLIKRPQDWPFSSYKEYIGENVEHPICQFNEVIDLQTKEYKKFISERIDYQRELAIIKKYIVD